MTPRAAARLISCLGAAASAGVILLYPRLIASDSASVPHGWLALALLGTSLSLIHGLGFRVRGRLGRALLAPPLAWALLLLGWYGVLGGF